MKKTLAIVLGLSSLILSSNTFAKDATLDDLCDMGDKVRTALKTLGTSSNELMAALMGDGGNSDQALTKLFQAVIADSKIASNSIQESLADWEVKGELANRQFENRVKEKVVVEKIFQVIKSDSQQLGEFQKTVTPDQQSVQWLLEFYRDIDSNTESLTNFACGEVKKPVVSLDDASPDSK